MEWQTMESAPKDGRRLIGFDPQRGTAVFHWNHRAWYPSDEADKFDGFYYPTHWMPLPAPPEKEAAPGLLESIAEIQRHEAVIQHKLTNIELNVRVAAKKAEPKNKKKEESDHGVSE